MCQRNSGRKHQSYEAEKVASLSKMTEKVHREKKANFFLATQLTSTTPIQALRLGSTLTKSQRSTIGLNTAEGL